MAEGSGFSIQRAAGLNAQHPTSNAQHPRSDAANQLLDFARAKLLQPLFLLSWQEAERETRLSKE